MNNIEVALLNPEALKTAEDMAVAMARLTQRAEKISSVKGLKELLLKPHSDQFVHTLCNLPHPTLQKFAVLNFVVVGASRRFLTQITRHQNEVKFMSGSLQYSDYSGAADYCVPYEIMQRDQEDLTNGDVTKIALYYTKQYQNYCNVQQAVYEDMIKAGIAHDAAAYLLPQGLRNVLIISATPYQLKHMISQRICKRNSLETQYVMLKLWELVADEPMFANCGCSCMHGKCAEGKMSCGASIVTHDIAAYTGWEKCSLPTAIIANNFPLLLKKENKHV